MFKSKLFLTCFLSLAVASCMSVSTGNSSGRAIEAYAKHDTANKLDITFSVEVYSNSGIGSICTESDIIHSIRENFAKSGMFKRVDYALPENAGPFHYHFRIDQTRDVESQFFTALVSATSLTCIPVWNNTDVKWIMRYQVNGRDVHIATSHQGYTDVVWAPFVITLPFLNRQTAGKDIMNNAMGQFVNEIRNKKLNTIHQ